MTKSAKTATAAEPSAGTARTITSSATTAAAAAPSGDRTVVRPLPLWRNLQFQTLWIGTSASTLGVSVTDFAYPLTVLAVSGSPALAGLFAAVQAIGMLLAGLPAGMLADKSDSRTIVIWT
jgi:hypothetical protein